MHGKRHARLLVEQLEDRCVPAYLEVTNGVPATIAGVSNTEVYRGFQMGSSLSMQSLPFTATNGQRQVVQSMKIQPIDQPTQAEWALLQQFFPGGWSHAQGTLSDGSLRVLEYEAFSPPMQQGGVQPRVGQTFFLRYSPHGNDPIHNGSSEIHWIQFVTSNIPPRMLGGGVNMPGIDNTGATGSPFYDVFSSADEMGLVDIPSAPIALVPNTISFQADLFLVRKTGIGRGEFWQGIRWGYETGPAPNRAPKGKANAITTPENTAYVFAAADFGFTDPHDRPANHFQAVKITSLPGTGTLTDNGAAVSAGDYVSVTDINAGLLVYTPAANSTGAPYDDFTFQVRDDGGTDDGGIDTNPIARTMSINVMASAFVNHAPAGASKTVSTSEDTPYVFSAGDFGFTDPNDSPANHLRGVQITSVPSAGWLTDNGVPLSAGAFVSVSDINDGLLLFWPDPGTTGSPYASFTFQVQDDGGTANGGVNLDPTPRILILNVAAVNHPPVAHYDAVSTFVNTPVTIAILDNDNDPEDDPLTVTSVTQPSNGTAVLNADHTITYTPAAGFSGFDFFSYVISDPSGGTAWAAVTVQVTKRDTMTSLYSWNNPAAYGLMVTFTAMVTPSGEYGITTGAVSFYANGVLLGSAALMAGTASFSTTSLQPGPHAITAVYEGDLVYQVSSSAPLTQTITPPTTTTYLSSSANPAALGQQVTFWASVMPSGSTGMLTGTVSFLDGETLLGTVPLNGGMVSFTISTLASGSHAITAAYSGDEVFPASTSAVLTQTVTAPTTTTYLSSSANPAFYGQQVTFWASVMPSGAFGSPTGSVSFHDVEVLLGTVALNAGMASFTTSSLGVGSHSITAIYSGDNVFPGSASVVLTQTINRADTSTMLMSSQNPAPAGSTVTFTATVYGMGSTPSGSVEFWEVDPVTGANLMLLGTVTLDPYGVAVLSLSFSQTGTHRLKAVYLGSDVFNSSSTTFDQSIT